MVCINAIASGCCFPPKKPKYRFFIWNKTKKKFVQNPETKKPFMFEFGKQSENFIERRLGGSQNFMIIDLLKLKKNKHGKHK